MFANVKILMEYNIKVELWLASQEITSSRLRSSNTKETTSDGVQKHITKEPLDGSYLNNSDCISSTTVQQEEASHVEDAKNRLNHAGPSCSTEAVVSSTTPSCQTEKSKDL